MVAIENHPLGREIKQLGCCLRTPAPPPDDAKRGHYFGPFTSTPNITYRRIFKREDMLELEIFEILMWNGEGLKATATARHSC